MKIVFLEAGSGARRHVPAEMVKAVAGYVSVPIIVGGGIKTPDDARSLADAGASFIVTGDVIEKKGGMEMLRDFKAAIHSA